MIRPPRMPVRTSVLLALAALLLCIGTPATFGAFSATITSSASAAFNPWFGCRSLAAGTAQTAVFIYGLDDAEGATTAPDLSGKGNAGTYSAAVHQGQERSAPCRRDEGGFWLPGGANGLTTPALPLPTNFAYETWFRSDRPDRVLMSIDLQPYGLVALAIDGTGGLVLAGLGTEFLHSSVPAGSVADGAWHHLVMNAGNGSLAFWVDGTMLPGNAVNVPDNLTVTYHIGTGTPNSPASVSSAQPFDGALRFAALYGTVLSPAEIAQHRAAGRVGPDPNASAPAPSASATSTAPPSSTPSTTPTSSTAPSPSASPSASSTSAPVTAAPEQTTELPASQNASAQPVQPAPPADSTSSQPSQTVQPESAETTASGTAVTEQKNAAAVDTAG